MGTDEPTVEMPDWAPPNGPWCLKRWLPYRSKGWTVCALEYKHEGSCREPRGSWLNHDNSLFLGDHDGPRTS
jgi:hypothetical protein